MKFNLSIPRDCSNKIVNTKGSVTATPVYNKIVNDKVLTSTVNDVIINDIIKPDKVDEMSIEYIIDEGGCDFE